MYCTPSEKRTARKKHKCTNCGEDIEVGTTYARWMSVDDDKGFANKMHLECVQSLNDENGSGSWEYSLYEGERPSLI